MGQRTGKYLNMSYKHECHVSSLIDELVNVASEVKDKASQDFLWGYVREQVEEEATAQNIVEKLRKMWRRSWHSVFG